MNLEAFVKESNRIEGIHHVSENDMSAHRVLLQEKVIRIPDMEAFVRSIQYGAVLRDKLGLNVYVGDHVPPKGGPHIAEQLDALLADLDSLSPYDAHVQYETLHPFTDGNGRSGRALWLWMMNRGKKWNHIPPLGFLHTWYYQSLAGSHHRLPLD